MKLFASFSEAIREGAKLRPQVFGSMERDNRSCAFGAGYEAFNGSLVGVSVEPVEKSYPYLASQTRCPISGCDVHDWSFFADDPPTVTDVIIHLNDDHKWTREAIADWLETEEERLGFVTLTLVEPEPVYEFAPSTTERCRLIEKQSSQDTHAAVGHVES